MVMEVLCMYFKVLMVVVVMGMGSSIPIYTLLKFWPSLSLPPLSLHRPASPPLSLILSVVVLGLGLSLITVRRGRCH